MRLDLPNTSSFTLGLGILSWHGYDSLRKALASYQQEQFFDLFDETLLFLPECSDQGRAIGSEFGLHVKSTAQNLGIMGGFEAMAQAMTSDYVMLAENDFLLIVSHDAARTALTHAMKNMLDGSANVYRFRHLDFPGQKFYLSKHMRYHPQVGARFGTRLTAHLRRLLRPTKARRLSGFAAYIYTDPEKRFPKDITRTAGGDFLVSSHAINWANNVFLINRRYFLDTIIPAAKAHIKGRLVNGFPTIETELNRSKWWRNQNIWVGISNPGLFTHERMNDRGY